MTDKIMRENVCGGIEGVAMEQCRAITFVNFHIPRTEMANSKDIQYTTLGFFDGMLTQKVEIGDSKQELKNLWKYALKRTAKSVGHYSYQNIFCFGQEEAGGSCTDEELWAEGTDRKWPLVFVVFLQLLHYADGEKGIVRQCQELNSKIGDKIGSEGVFYTYSTVDKNDFVVCIKCRSYRMAVNAIKNLHTIKANVVYSYSVFSVSKKVLAQFDEVQYRDIYDEKIDSICLKGVANSFSIIDDTTLDQKYMEYGEKLVDKLYGEHKADYRIYDILGDDDFRLIARDVRLGRLLKEYAEGGLLDSQKEQVRFYLFSNSMVLNVNAPSYSYPIQEQIITKTLSRMNKEFQAPLCKKLEEKMKEISAKIKEQGEDDNWSGQEEVATFCSAIWQLLQSLKALEIPKTKKYDFWSIYHPLAQLISILEEKMKCRETLAELSSHEEIFDFIHKISMTLHGTLRTDIQFFQIRDFNAIVHYAPSKLRAFYSLWAIQLSDYYSEFGYSDCGKSYSFILAPGMFSKVLIKQLFVNDAEKDRLMLICVPERQLYMLKELSIMLGHEVSHYVGARVRHRQLRHKAMIGIMTRLLALEMNYYRWRVCKDKWKTELEKVISGSDLHERLEKLILWADEEVCRDWGDIADRYHSHNSIKMIKKAYQYLAKTYLSKIIGEDCEKYNQSLKKIRNPSPSMEKINEFQEIGKLSYEMEDSFKFFYQKFQGQLEVFLDIFYHILKETCADINSVLTLELTPEEYLQSFDSIEGYYDEQNSIEGAASLRVVRHALVLMSMKNSAAKGKNCFVNKDFSDCWAEFDIISYTAKRKEGLEEQRALWIFEYLEGITGLRNMNQCIRSYKSAYDYQEECFQTKLLGFLNDKIIWEKMLFYGIACVESYLEILSENKKDLIGKKETLVNTCRGFADVSVSRQLQIIENFLSKCEQELSENNI